MRVKSVLGLASTHRFSKVSVRRRVSKGPRAANLGFKALRVGSEVEACTRNPVAGGVGEPPRMQESLRSADLLLYSTLLDSTLLDSTRLYSDSPPRYDGPLHTLRRYSAVLPAAQVTAEYRLRYSRVPL